MITSIETKDCIICLNCKNICPVQAITFDKKEGMFFYPKVDEKKCIGCHKCDKVCPVLNSLPQKRSIEAYAVKNRDKIIKKESSSGGIFTALAENVILEGGYVFGAAFEEKYLVKHIEVKQKKELSKLRGSKYVQSNLENCFIRIQELLCAKETVLFSGTPCQCAALKNFLKPVNHKGKIYMVDFVCHGILSPQLFQEYILFLEKRRKSEIVKFNFRDKTYGWIDSGPSVTYKNGKNEKWPLYEDLYMQGYFQGLCMRESCYHCKYKNFYSGSDITMGDFWGAEILIPDFYDIDGVSMCCVQTENGKRLFEKARRNLDVKKVPLETLAKYNEGLFYPFSKGEKSEAFYQIAKEKGNINALRKVTRIKKIECLKRIYRHLKRKWSIKDE